MIIILGDGGHAKVVRGAFMLGPIVEIRPWDADVAALDKLAHGMGGPDYKRQLVELHGERRFVSAIHPGAIILGSAHLGVGVQIMARAIVQVGAHIGNYVLVNTGAQIDHDCHIGDYCEISPGAVLCGNVTLGEGCRIGANATVVQGVTLDAGTKIPAGSLVVRQDDVRASRRVVCVG